jgi:hypothetical protein
VRIERQAQRVVVALDGTLDAAGARALLAALGGELEQKQVLIDLRGADDYQPDAREPLLEVQRAFARHGCRSVWLAERARLRGLALWLMHAAGDPAARAVLTLEQAEAWLGSSELRLDGAGNRTQEALRAVVRSLEATHRRLERLK